MGFEFPQLLSHVTKASGLLDSVSNVGAIKLIQEACWDLGRCYDKYRSFSKVIGKLKIDFHRDVAITWEVDR